MSELVIYGLVSNSLVVKFGTAVHSAPGNERRLHCGGGYSNLAAAKGIASNLPGSNQPRTLGDPLDALERWDATRHGPVHISSGFLLWARAREAGELPYPAKIARLGARTYAGLQVIGLAWSPQFDARVSPPCESVLAQAHHARLAAGGEGWRSCG